MSLNREVDDMDNTDPVTSDNVLDDTVVEDKEKYEVVEFNDWEEMDLKKDVLSIYHGLKQSYTKKAIKPIFDGKDVIAQAQSGTGEQVHSALVPCKFLILRKIKCKF